MEQPKTYDNYPCWIRLVANFVSLGIYAIGAIIIYQIGLIWLCLYLIYAIILEIRLMKKSCANCYYFGKNCAFGKGKISSWFFKKGEPEKFINRKISWQDILPEFLASLIPLIIGIILLILNFNWWLLILIILLIILTSAGNGFVRGSLACKYCKQKTCGCPAEKLFNKRK
jgi:hypothetical protein